MQLGMTPTCTLCPRACNVPRSLSRGYCGATDQIKVAAVCIHQGEEPPLVGPASDGSGTGIVNIFFAHCNLQCIYCQNWQISERSSAVSRHSSLPDLIDRCCQLLPHSAGLIGLVTAAHYAPILRPLVDGVRARGLDPVVVYNSSGYESIETLRSLEGLVDIYLPDFKYSDPALASAYSHAPDYPAVAQAAILEMRRQVGTTLKTHNGVAYRGLIVRHLVLPGAVDNSIGCLEWLADQFPFGLHLSLMAQYYPPRPGLPAPLDRTVTATEYRAVVDRAETLGLTDGWVQELTAQSTYRPDFTLNNPFQP